MTICINEMVNFKFFLTEFTVDFFIIQKLSGNVKKNIWENFNILISSNFNVTPDKFNKWI